MGLAALDSWPEEWEQHPLVPGVQPARVPVCNITRDEHGVAGRGGGPLGRVRAKPASLSAGLHLLHEEGNHEVSLGRKGGRPGNNFLSIAGGCLQFDKAQ